jgi:hypothetical protein
MIDYTFASALLSTKTASLLNKAQFRELRNTDDDGFSFKTAIVSDMFGR